MKSDANQPAVIWVHDEMISPTWLTYLQKRCDGDEADAVFVFDDGWIADERLSLKRLVFMAECLEQMPGVEVRRGDVVEEVSAFAHERKATRIVTVGSPLPRLREQGERLDTEWVEPPPFVELNGRVDLKRFSRYWNKAKKQAYEPTPGGSHTQGDLFDA